MCKYLIDTHSSAKRSQATPYFLLLNHLPNPLILTPLHSLICPHSLISSPHSLISSAKRSFLLFDLLLTTSVTKTMLTTTTSPITTLFLTPNYTAAANETDKSWSTPSYSTRNITAEANGTDKTTIVTKTTTRKPFEITTTKQAFENTTTAYEPEKCTPCIQGELGMNFVTFIFHGNFLVCITVNCSQFEKSFTQKQNDYFKVEGRYFK